MGPMSEVDHELESRLANGQKAWAYPIVRAERIVAALYTFDERFSVPTLSADQVLPVTVSLEFRRDRNVQCIEKGGSGVDQTEWRLKNLLLRNWWHSQQQR